nr:hypothetical protein Iba_chr07cCG15310 [Ipomoea batatas]
MNAVLRRLIYRWQPVAMVNEKGGVPQRSKGASSVEFSSEMVPLLVAYAVVICGRLSIVAAESAAPSLPVFFPGEDFSSVFPAALVDGAGLLRNTNASLPSLLLRWRRSRNLQNLENPVELLFLQPSGPAAATTAFPDHSQDSASASDDVTSAVSTKTFSTGGFSSKPSKSAAPSRRSRLNSG